MSAPRGRRARQFGRRARLAAWRRARQAQQHMQRVASQAPEAARKAGRALARHVISVQRSAGLDRKPKTARLMEQSYALTVGEHKGAEPSPDWVAGYAEQAAAMIPAVQAAQERDAWSAVQPPELPEPPAARPTWPFGPSSGPEPDEPEAGS
jgi:hypothetical protein